MHQLKGRTVISGDLQGLPGVKESVTGMSVPSASRTAGVSARHSLAPVMKTVFTLNAVAVSLTDATTAGAHGSVQLADFAEGLVRVLGGVTDLALTIGSGLASAVVCGVGSTAAATDNATLSTTEQNVIPSTSCSITASAATFKGKATATEGAVVLDGASSAIDLFLNMVATDANTTGSGPFTVTATGTITIYWIPLGDN